MTWLLLLLFVVFAGLHAKKQPLPGLIASGVFSVFFLFFLYLIFKTEPYAIRIYPDRFELCYILGRKKYLFTDIADISLSTVHYRKSGDVESVRVDFRQGRHLQIQALNSRRKFFEDLRQTWRRDTA